MNSETNMNITITENAKNKIFDLLVEEGNKELMLRVFVQGGGCSGFQYGFSFEEFLQEDDFKINVGDFFVVIDSMSLAYLQGATIDYKEELMGSQFVISNPNATTTCGCGSSFSI